MAIDIEQIETDLQNSLTILQNPGVTQIVEQIANLTTAYYKQLIIGGVPVDHAATITASYSSQIAALKP